MSPAAAFVTSGCMFIASCPLAATMRATAMNGSLLSDSDSNKLEQRERYENTIMAQMNAFSSAHAFPLFVTLFLMILSEEYNSSRKYMREVEFLPMLFELCSAYGTVGLSMTGTATSRSAGWCRRTQFLVIVVMVLGRIRMFPGATDPPVQWHHDQKTRERLDLPASAEANTEGQPGTVRVKWKRSPPPSGDPEAPWGSREHRSVL